jgi:hypothetical protein
MRLALPILLFILLLLLSHPVSSSDDDDMAAPTTLHIPINVLNLDRCPERWESVQKQLLKDKKIDISNVKRLPAVDGKALDSFDLSFKTTRLARLFATRGMIGCYLSHREFWMQVLKDNHPYQIILEDDVLLEDDFHSRAEQAIAELESCPETKGTWDVLMLGALGCVHPQGQYGGNRIHAFVAGGGRRLVCALIAGE